MVDNSEYIRDPNGFVVWVGDRYDHDRCCCECGEHFDGTLEDDYCSDCWDKLGLGEING